MHLFEVVPAELFPVLASPNRLINSNAFAVLYDVFRENLKISKNTYYGIHPEIP